MSNGKNCYNSYSCIFSVLLILFVLGSILWDMLVTKPAMRESIEEIKQEVQTIHKTLDEQYAVQDSIELIENGNVDDSVFLPNDICAQKNDDK